MKQSLNTAILLIHCPDQKGLVAAVTTYLFDHKANILDLDQHVDHEDSQFFMRVRWTLEGFDLSKAELEAEFDVKIAQPFQMNWQLHYGAARQRMAVFVSKMSHCLYDILQRQSTGEWKVDIPLIISNHPGLQSIADRFDIPFHIYPITKENKAEQESKILQLLNSHAIDFVVLARYMQIITDHFIGHYPNRIINIHHSFLPAFVGAKPYHQAHARGVKIIGATSHYVTPALDAGPIIAQDVEHISHHDRIADLVRKGRDLEKVVLAKAIWHQLHHNILPYRNRTVVFNP